MRITTSPFKQRSIASFLLVVILSIVVLQSLLFGVALIGGGVLTSSTNYADQVFHEKVGSRLNTLQNDMVSQWSRIGTYTERLAALPYPAPAERNDETLLALWQQALPVLRDMLRSTSASDAFIILQGTTGGTARKALYLRKIEPNRHDSEITLLTGPGELLKTYPILPSHLWTHDLELRPETLPIVENPLSLLGSHPNLGLLAYWSPLVVLQPGTTPAIFHSMPLVDDQGEARGVIGVGVHESYLGSLLPQRELSPKDTLGYLLAHRVNDKAEITPMLFTSNAQRALLPAGTPLRTDEVNARLHIGKLRHDEAPDSVYACVLPLRLYTHQTPFENETWYLVGLIKGENLYQVTDKLKIIFMGALLASIALGCIGAALVIRGVTRPIVTLAEHVEGGCCTNNLQFERTGFREIDHLTSTIEAANSRIMHSTTRILQLIDMTDIPMGMFEVRHNMPGVFATDGLKRLFDLDDHEARALYNDKDRFMERLKVLMSRPEPEENTVYKIGDDPEKWINLYMVNDHETLLGVVTDVSDDMYKKRRIRRERDYDALTGLCSRNFFRRQVSTLMGLDEGTGLAAMLMLDLDNFKRVNDQYGHQCGDDYLNAVAQAMTAFSSPHSVIGRRSGDEFFVFLFRLESRDAMYKLVNNLYTRLANEPFTFPDKSHTVIGISMGLAWYTTQPSFEALLHEADMALYEAKQTACGSLREHTESVQNSTDC